VTSLQQLESQHKLGGQTVNRLLVPFSLAAWLGFLAVGIPLPALPLFVHDRLGFDPLIVGIVVGAQSFATLISRQYAGRMCDGRGPKPTTLVGLATASAAGLCYLAASHWGGSRSFALTLLIFGRLLLGVGESLFITAIAAWSVSRVGAANAGRAMAWSGISMYGALAIGAPIGTYIYRSAGFDGIAMCTFVVPLFGAIVAASIRSLRVEPRAHVSYFKILGSIWAPGLGMALASSGIGTISAFLALYYGHNGWQNVGTALTAFGSAYILMRLLFGGLPDRIGGFAVAQASLVVEAAGLLTIWCATSPEVALGGAALTGLGYSLIFPSLGVEALKRTTPQNRGLVLSAYLACFDLGVAMAGPVSGIVAQAFGVSAVFPAAACASIVAFALTIITRYSSSSKAGGAP
jgi:MFS family permease